MGHYTCKNGKWFDKKTGEAVKLPDRSDSWKPGTSVLIAKDYEGYTCPVTNKWIEGKAAHRENLKKHNCRNLEKGEREHNDKTRREELDRACKETARDFARMAAERYDSLTTR